MLNISKISKALLIAGIIFTGFMVMPSNSVAQDGTYSEKEITDAKKAVANAQADVAKFCDADGKRYNEKKCTKSNQELAAALENPAYQYATVDAELSAAIDSYVAESNAYAASQAAAEAALDAELGAAVDAFASDAAAIDAVNKAKANAQQLCQANASGKECQSAKEQYQSLVEKNINALCGNDGGCRAAYLYGEAVVEGSKDQDMSQIKDLVTEGRKIDMHGEGPDSWHGYRSKYFNYDASGDVLETVTRRAALAVVSAKTIAYVFACFGLVAFAWMAIFGKISWKWFANIAMGLFLVANMGRFIEYFVIGDGVEQHYYIGVWGDGAKGKGDSSKMLANAFKDSFYVYGDHLDTQKGLFDFSDVIAANEAARMQAYYESIGMQVVDGKVVPIEGGMSEEEARKFCQKDLSISGWANFSSCIKDVIATGKKVADTATDVYTTVKQVENRVDMVKGTIKEIGNAIDDMNGASLGEIVNNIGNIINDTTFIVSTTTGTVGVVSGTIGDVADNVQDIGKSREQQQRNESIRGQGDATNAVNAFLNGQAWDKENKEVEKERVDATTTDNEGNTHTVTDAYGNTVTTEQNVSADNWYTGLQNTLDTVNDRSQDLGNDLQEGLSYTGQTVGVVENVVKDISGTQQTFSPRLNDVTSDNNDSYNSGGTNGSGTSGSQGRGENTPAVTDKGEVEMPPSAPKGPDTAIPLNPALPKIDLFTDTVIDNSEQTPSATGNGTTPAVEGDNPNTDTNPNFTPPSLPDKLLIGGETGGHYDASEHPADIMVQDSADDSKQAPAPKYNRRTFGGGGGTSRFIDTFINEEDIKGSTKDVRTKDVRYTTTLEYR